MRLTAVCEKQWSSSPYSEMTSCRGHIYLCLFMTAINCLWWSWFLRVESNSYPLNYAIQTTDFRTLCYKLLTSVDYLILTIERCVTYYWPLNSAQHTIAFYVTYYWFLNSMLHTSDLSSLGYLLQTLEFGVSDYWPAFCGTFSKNLNLCMFHTTDLWTLCYLLLTSELCVTYYWPPHSALLAPEILTVLHTIDLCTLWHLLQISELCFTY